MQQGASSAGGPRRFSQRPPVVDVDAMDQRQAQEALRTFSDPQLWDQSDPRLQALLESLKLQGSPKVKTSG